MKKIKKNKIKVSKIQKGHTNKTKINIYIAGFLLLTTAAIIFTANQSMTYINYAQGKAQNQACSKDLLMCADGSYVQRSGENCQFAKCSSGNTVFNKCPATLRCSDGTILQRNSWDECTFPSCSNNQLPNTITSTPKPTIVSPTLSPSSTIAPSSTTPTKSTTPQPTGAQNKNGGGDILGGIMNFLGGLINGFMEIFSGVLGGFIGQVFTTIGGYLQNLLTSAGQFVSSIPIIGGALSALISAVGGFLQSMMGSIGGFVKGLF